VRTGNDDNVMNSNGHAMFVSVVKQAGVDDTCPRKETMLQHVHLPTAAFSW